MPQLLIGYDVESMNESAAVFLQAAERLHGEMLAPASLFIVGRTLERNVEACRRALASGWFEFHQHTYSHALLKTVLQENEEGVRMFAGVSFEQAREEIVKGQEALKRHLGVDCRGLTAPYNYYRGLGDRPDLLAVLRRCGITILRSAGRNERDWQPVPFAWQPYFYDPQGYPEILEFPLHGWQDCLVRERLGWENIGAYVDRLKRDVDHAVRGGHDFVYCSHDWSSIRHDPALDHLREFIRYAREQGMEIGSYSAYYDDKRAQLPANR